MDAEALQKTRAPNMSWSNAKLAYFNSVMYKDEPIDFERLKGYAKAFIRSESRAAERVVWAVRTGSRCEPVTAGTLYRQIFESRCGFGDFHGFGIMLASVLSCPLTALAGRGGVGVIWANLEYFCPELLRFLLIAENVHWSRAVAASGDPSLSCIAGRFRIRSSPLPRTDPSETHSRMTGSKERPRAFQ